MTTETYFRRVVALILVALMVVFFFSPQLVKDSMLKLMEDTEETKMNPQETTSLDWMPEATTTKSAQPVVDFQSAAFTSSEFDELFRSFKSTQGLAPNSIMYNVKNIFKKEVVTNEHRNKFVIKPRVDQCRINPNYEQKLTLLGLLMIGPDNFERRRLIRETWANKNLSNNSDFRLVFCLGLSKNSTINELVKQESATHNDILLEDFTDNYFNLTIKVIGAYKFATEYCANNVEYVLRVNDDLVINIKYLIKFLKNLSEQGRREKSVVRNAIMGNIQPHTSPDRNEKSKWYVPEADYQGRRYFPYMEGSVHVMTFDVAAEMYQLSRYVYWRPFSVSLEDVYIGLLCMHLQTNYIQMLPHFLTGDQWGARLDALKHSPNKQDLFFIFAHESDDYKAKWDVLIKELY